MIRVKNKKLMRKLAIKSFFTSKTRNIIAIFAIALTTLLFTSLFTMGLGLKESMNRADMILSGGDGEARANYLSESEYQKISGHSLVKEIAYCRKLAESVDNSSLAKRSAELWYYDAVGLKYAFANPTSGHEPKAEDEIIADTKTLELLGVPLKTGAKLSLEITVHGQKKTRDFVLAGWWESYPGVQTGTIVASKAYVSAYEDELYNTYAKDHSESGTITGIMKFQSKKNVEQDLKTVITESGFSMDEKDSNFIDTGINPRFLSKNSSTGTGTIAALTCALLLFVFTGYLIIYNIFQISVLQDMHQYGLLKTIGTTGRQLYAMIRWQSIILSILGIPIGLCGGFFTGRALLPKLMAQSNFAKDTVVVSKSPLIFLFAALFSLITVFISTRKPAKLAAKVSPIEAVLMTDADLCGTKKKTKKILNGIPQRRMARTSFLCNKKRTILVILSLSLSVVLTNVVFNFSQSVDAEHALKNVCDSNFRIGSSDLFYQYQVNQESAISESFIQAVEKQDGFLSGGRQYGCRASYTSKTTKQIINQQEDGSYATHVYGLDDFPFSKLQLVDGKIDREKLATGVYILEGVWVNSRGIMDEGTMNHAVGDKVLLKLNGKTQEVTVLGHVVANETNTYDWVESCYYLPSDVYQTLTGESYAMSYVFDVDKDKEEDVNLFLKQYTNHVEPTMSYKSKFTTLAGVQNIKNTIVSIGGTIALIIGLIGILNYLNTVLTSILVRRREFAMLQSVGMTGRQLVGMICREGFYYIICTAVLSSMLSLAGSILIVRPICRQIWFFNFRFNFWPLLMIIPLFLVLGVIVPYLAYRLTEHQSIVERLRIEV